MNASASFYYFCILQKKKKKTLKLRQTDECNDIIWIQVHCQMLSILKIIFATIHRFIEMLSFLGACLFVLQEVSPHIHTKCHNFSIIWHKIEVSRAYGSVQGEGLLVILSILSTSSPLHFETDDDDFWEISVSFSVPPWQESGVGYQRAWDPGWVWMCVGVHASVAVFRALLVVYSRSICVDICALSGVVCCIEMYCSWLH